MACPNTRFQRALVVYRNVFYVFCRVESREVDHQTKPNSASLEMEDMLAAMPKGSSNDDSGHVLESLLSEMHDLSFMLADHLVIPDRNGKHSIY